MTGAAGGLGCGRKRQRWGNLLVDKWGGYGIMRAGDGGMRRDSPIARRSVLCSLGCRVPPLLRGYPRTCGALRIILGRVRWSADSPSEANWPPPLVMGGNR